MLPFWELYPLLSHWCIAILYLLCDYDGDSNCENMQQQLINIYIYQYNIYLSAILLTTKIIDHRGDSSGIFGGLPISTNKSCHKIGIFCSSGSRGVALFRAVMAHSTSDNSLRRLSEENFDFRGIT